MSLALRYVGPEDASLLCERLASVCRMLGVPESEIDRVVDSGLTPMLIQIEASLGLLPPH